MPSSLEKSLGSLIENNHRCVAAFADARPLLLALPLALTDHVRLRHVLLLRYTALLLMMLEALLRLLELMRVFRLRPSLRRDRLLVLMWLCLRVLALLLRLCSLHLLCVLSLLRLRRRRSADER